MNTFLKSGFYRVVNTKFPKHQPFYIQVKDTTELGLIYRIIGQFGFWPVSELPWFWDINPVDANNLGLILNK